MNVSETTVSPLESVKLEGLTKTELRKLAGRVIDTRCRTCQTNKIMKKEAVEKGGNDYAAQKYCMTECAVGIDLRKIGNALEALKTK